MPRSSDVYLEDILHAIDRIRGYTLEMDFEAFANDPKTFDAVVRNLEVIGEASKKLPIEIREQATEVEWRKITGMRDMLAHAYFSIDPRIVWDVVANGIDKLAESITRLRG